MSRPKIVILSYTPSPYQVEFFNGIAKSLAFDIVVGYLVSVDDKRKWSRAKLSHNYYMLDENLPDCEDFFRKCEECELLVVNYYNHKIAQSVIARRSASKRAWVFWGERPGFKWGFLGRFMRLWKLRHLRAETVPIWGMGDFAIDGYRQEFGVSRRYSSVPYFSDLQRFRCSRVANHDMSTTRTILFSGLLIRRKGVDLLCKAFARVAHEHPQARLLVLGFGPLERQMRLYLAGVMDKVEFLGFADWEGLPAVYAKADILCVPSRHDGWGLVVPEGLASGLPVIATDRMGAAVDLVRPGLNGWLCRGGDLASLENALTEAVMLDDDTLRQMMLAAERSIVNHSLENGVQRFLIAAAEAIQDSEKSQAQ